MNEDEIQIVIGYMLNILLGDDPIDEAKAALFVLHQYTDYGKETLRFINRDRK